jgi:hypothetical protein
MVQKERKEKAGNERDAITFKNAKFCFICGIRVSIFGRKVGYCDNRCSVFSLYLPDKF